MIKFAIGAEALTKLGTALGIPPEAPVQRIILDIGVDRVATVYVQQLLPAGAMDELLAVLVGDGVERLPQSHPGGPSPRATNAAASPSQRHAQRMDD
jgi:hypothetical protein